MSSAFFGATIALAAALIRPSSSEAADRIGGAILMDMTDCCSDEAWPEAEDAVISELSLENIPVMRVKSMATDARERLDEMRRVSKSWDATAVIRITRYRPKDTVTVDLWLIEALTDRSVYRQLNMMLENQSASTLDVAVRTVEALRATFLESQLTLRVAAPPTAVPITLERSYPLLGIGTEANVLASPGGNSGVRGGYGISAILEPVEGLDLELGFVASPFGSDLVKGNVSSSLDCLLFRGTLSYRFSTNSMVAPAIGISGGTLIVSGEGETQTDTFGTVSVNDRETVAYLGGTVRLYLKANSALFIVFGVSAGITLPKIVIVHNTVELGQMGRPLIDGILGVQVRFP